MITILSENGYKFLFKKPFRQSDAPRIANMFGPASSIVMLRYGKQRSRRWFADIEFEEAWYAFKEEKDAVMFKLAFGGPDTLMVIL